jgi:type IV secretory pathway VirB4 component
MHTLIEKNKLRYEITQLVTALRKAEFLLEFFKENLVCEDQEGNAQKIVDRIEEELTAKTKKLNSIEVTEYEACLKKPS